MFRASRLAHLLIQERLRTGDAAIDATAGNGHDTVFLAQTVGSTGRVFAFDVQESAVAAARERVAAAGIAPETCAFFCQGHETMAGAIPPEWQGRIGAVLFNLGYLPGGDHDLTTGTETTLAALRVAIRMVRKGGLIVLVLYPGHPAGAEEAGAVKNFADGLPPGEFHVTEITARNTRSPAPGVLVLEKLA